MCEGGDWAYRVLVGESEGKRSGESGMGARTGLMWLRIGTGSGQWRTQEFCSGGKGVNKFS
jgi:hypothetical protein